LKFRIYVIDINKFIFQKFHGKKENFNPWAQVVKVGSNEFFSQLHMLVDFVYFFIGESFGLEI